MSRHEQATDVAQNATDAASQGPPSDLPGAVPAVVGEIHSSINEFLGGGVESLGHVISGVASGGGATDAAAAAVEVATAIPV